MSLVDHGVGNGPCRERHKWADTWDIVARAGEMARKVGALPALPEEQGSATSTSMVVPKPSLSLVPGDLLNSTRFAHTIHINSGKHKHMHIVYFLKNTYRTEWIGQKKNKGRKAKRPLQWSWTRMGKLNGKKGQLETDIQKSQGFDWDEERSSLSKS